MNFSANLQATNPFSKDVFQMRWSSIFADMLKAINLYKSYGSLEVLRGVSLEISQSEVVSIVGASGSGKSTLLHVLGTLDLPDRGEVWLDQQDLLSLNDKVLAKTRNKSIGFVFQFHNLLPEFSCVENVCMPGFIAGTKESEVLDRAKELLHMLGMSHRLTHRPSELSGGEQQRISVARALINKPSIVFADEPSGNLDSRNAKELHELFFRLRKELKQAFVLVTHNEELAQMADRKLEMRDGKILQR